MGKYNFKDKYYDYDGVNPENLYELRFISLIGTGTGSRTSPFKAFNVNLEPTTAKFCFVFGNGYYRMPVTGFGTTGGTTANMDWVGSGINKTIFDLSFTSIGSSGDRKVRVSDMSILKLTTNTYTNGRYFHFKNCDITELSVAMLSSIVKSIVRTDVTIPAGNNLSFVGIQNKKMSVLNLNLYEDCEVFITDLNISGLKNNYNAFNKCRFKIGSETSFTPLNGLDEDNLREDFKSRCEAQFGIGSVPNVTDYGETLPLGRWVFSNDSCIDGRVLKNSVIHNFEKRRLIYFGFSDIRTIKIPIVTDANIPASFTSSAPFEKTIITKDSIALDSSVDVTKGNNAFADSKVIWLGGLSKVNYLDIIHNFPMEYGINIDSSFGLSNSPVSEIKPYENGVMRTYIVRSTNELEATVKYSSVNYSSSLLTRNNVFRGVSGATAFEPSSNALIYEILDEVLHQTIQMRIVNKIPNDIIKTGNLLNDYWYFVEHDNDQTNLTDYITYKGVNYKVGDSFLVDGTLTFSKTGEIHLRRCWHDKFEWYTGNGVGVDSDFWKNEQKPQWFDVVPDDLSCLLKNNASTSIEMQADSNGKYIGTGHPDFYNRVLGYNGSITPSFPIKGTYMQIRLVISTINPM